MNSERLEHENKKNLERLGIKLEKKKNTFK
jgi:hypothetical protein